MSKPGKVPMVGAPASRHYPEALARHPEVQDRLTELDAALRAGRIAEVEPQAQALKAQHPRIAEVDLMLGRVHIEYGRWTQAWDVLERLLEVAPRNPVLMSLKVQVLEKLEQRDASESALEDLLAHHPDHVGALLLQLERQRKTTDRVAAGRTLDALMAVAPDNPTVLYQLSMMRAVPAGDPVLARLGELVEDAGLSMIERSLAGFALGNLHLAAGNDGPAFEAYRRANAIARDSRPAVGLHPASVLHVWRTAGFLSRTDAERWSHGLDDRRLVLVLGASRSGKSLVESMLARHPRVTAAAESFRTGREAMALLASKDLESYLMSAPSSQLRADAREYLSRLGLEDSDDRYRVDTLPENLWRLPILSLWFPKMPLIFCQRDPLDQGMSIFCRFYRTGNRPYFDLYETGRYLRAYEDLQTLMERTLPNPILRVRYEDLARDPAGQATRLHEFLSLSPEPSDLAALTASPGDGDYLHPVDSHDRPTAIRKHGIGFHRRFASHTEPLLAGYTAPPDAVPLRDDGKPGQSKSTAGRKTESGQGVTGMSEKQAQDMITIDGVRYDPSKLPEEAKAQIRNLRVTDEEIQRLNQRLSIARTARAAYARALKDALPE